MAWAIVDRTWQGRFGRDLVATPNDCGFAGARQAPPDLIDRLTTDLMKHGWSLEHIRRPTIGPDGGPAGPVRPGSSRL